MSLYNALKRMRCTLEKNPNVLAILGAKMFSNKILSVFRKYSKMNLDLKNIQYSLTHLLIHSFTNYLLTHKATSHFKKWEIFASKSGVWSEPPQVNFFNSID